jgi:AraC-like DNA-binding protein
VDGARRDVLEALVRRRAPSTPDPTVALARLVTLDPSAGVDALVGHAGVSARQLRRRFDRAVGYGPAFLARLARLQRFAHEAVRRPERGLAELAASVGYTDQAHLAKDTRSIAGCTPRQLRASLGRSSIAVDLGTDGRSVHDGDGPTARRSVA